MSNDKLPKLILRHVGTETDIKKSYPDLILKGLDTAKLRKEKVQTKRGMAFRWKKNGEEQPKEKTPKLELKPSGKGSGNSKHNKPIGSDIEKEREVGVKLEELARVANEARDKGEQAPDFNLCEISIPNTNLFCKNNKGVVRAEMPQLKGKPTKGSEAERVAKEQGSDEADGEEKFKQYLKDNGVKMTQKKVAADSLKSTQNELVGAKVAGMTQALQKDPKHPAITAPIFVSKDGYVLDGHHRWAAHVGFNLKEGEKLDMEVIEVDMDIKQLLKETNEFADEFGIAQKAGKVNESSDNAEEEEEAADEGLDDAEGSDDTKDDTKDESGGGSEQGGDYAAIKAEVEKKLSRHSETFDATKNDLSALVPDGQLVGRIKEIESATDKVFIRRQSNPDYDLNDLADLTGFRTTAQDIKGVYKHIKSVKDSGKYDVLDEKDYIAHPKGIGYRRVHLILQEKESGKVFELQMGTANQTKFADWCHDVYKPQSESQAKMLEKSLDLINEYARKSAEVLNALDNHKKQGASTAPPCSHEIKVTFGCLDI